MATTSYQELYDELIALCRAGHLSELDGWFKSGKPTAPPTPRRRLTPIGVAIEQGFYSLVKVLLRHGVSPNGRPLRDAVFMGRADIVELLFKFGADVHSVGFVDAVLSHEPGIVRMFVEYGADLVTGYPIAEGLNEILELCILAIGVGLSLSPYVAACEKVLKDAGLKTVLHANGTNIEEECRHECWWVHAVNGTIC